jgi:SARP family transcriptional regulator, regulator of embCAB operon
LEFSILGPVEIRANGVSMEIRGENQRVLLTALQAHVSRLRRRLEALEPDHRPHRLLSSSSGYRMAFDENELDATRFMKILREVRSQPQLSPADVVGVLREALSLWRGPAFDSQSRGLMCQSAAARYEESRLAALELLYDNELKVGRHAEIIPELRQLTEASGLNERLCEQLMVALYRAGRQTDALAVYRQMWMRLKEEIGIEPSPTLKRYERAILTHSPILSWTADHLALRA